MISKLWPKSCLLMIFVSSLLGKLWNNYIVRKKDTKQKKKRNNIVNLSLFTIMYFVHVCNIRHYDVTGVLLLFSKYDLSLLSIECRELDRYWAFDRLAFVDVHLWLIGWDRAIPTPPPHSNKYMRALLVSQDRRHFFVTPWFSLYV
jgi:hypothetical protein